MEATARLINVNMSPKFSREVALAIKGKSISKARTLLEEVIAIKTPIELKRHNKEVAHKRGKPGRYPVKVAKNFIELLDNVLANAKYKGADEEKLIIDTIEVYRGRHKRTLGSKALGKVKVRSRRASVFLVVKERETKKTVAKKIKKPVKKETKAPVKKETKQPVKKKTPKAKKTEKKPVKKETKKKVEKGKK
ncbi:MAG: 50S ribosomal protein L22 [Candidatus Altiarchaeota archaeon]|nr:50S ribosomal protein L22 [Candidatus Altiarchaeota archaeon]